MITAYAGLPGTGKSYGVVKNVILPALKEGREVWSNIIINDDEMKKATNGKTTVHFETQDVIDNPRWFLDILPKGALCVLDEAWRLWPAGIKANNAVAEHKEYMAEIRHLVSADGFSSQLCIVTQDLAQIASFARLLVETTFVSYKLNMLGASKKYRIDIYSGPVTGYSPPKSKRLRQEFGSFDKKIYKLYKSHTKSDTGGAGNESRIDKRNNLLRGWRFKLMIPGLALACWLMYAGIGSLGDYYGSNEEQQVSEQRHPTSFTTPRTKRTSNSTADFFRDRENYITLNMGNGKDITYKFRSVDDESYVDLSVWDVRKMGYNVIMINECLVYFEERKTKIRSAVTCRIVKNKKDIFGLPKAPDQHI